MSHKCYKGEVHAFEVDPQLIPLIQENLALNQTGARVIINCMAISDTIGHPISFNPHQVDNISTNKISLSKSDKITNIQTCSTTVDNYCKINGAIPTFIKMDIEGAEALAIDGMKETMTKYAPKLLLELHPYLVKDFGRESKDIIKIINNLPVKYSGYILNEYRNNEEIELIPILDDFIFNNKKSIILFFKPYN